MQIVVRKQILRSLCFALALVLLTPVSGHTQSSIPSVADRIEAQSDNGPNLSVTIGGDAATLGAGVAEAAGRSILATAGRGIATGLDLAEVGGNVADGDIPAAVGGLAKAGGGALVPTCALAGTAVAGIVGSIGGGAICLKRANDLGNMVEDGTRGIADSLGLNRTPREKRLAKAGIDRNNYINDNLGGSTFNPREQARVQAEMLKEMMRNEGEQARRLGRSYSPEDELIQEIRELEEFATTSYSTSYAPLIGSETSDWDAKPGPESALKACSPRLLEDLGRKVMEISNPPGTSKYAIENRQEVDEHYRSCMHDANTVKSYTAADREWARGVCEDAYKIYSQARLDYEKSVFEEQLEKLQTQKGCQFEPLPTLSQNWKRPDISDQTDAVTVPQARVERSEPEAQAATQNADNASKTYIFKPPKLWLDSGPLLTE